MLPARGGRYPPLRPADAEADRDSIEGTSTLADGQSVALARVRAVPEDGAANAALVVLLAKTFGRPKSAVTLVRGATQRVKQMRIAGDPDRLGEIVESWKRSDLGCRLAPGVGDLGERDFAEALVGLGYLAAAGVAIEAAGILVVGQRPDHDRIETEAAELAAGG